MLFRQITDEKLAQYAYLFGCQRTGEALLIDPERDIDRYLSLAEKEGLTITAVAETHIHADFLSGAREFAERGIHVYVSDEGEDDWKYRWTNRGHYDVTYLRDGDVFHVGNIEVKALHTPGHTPEHLLFQITDCGGGADDPLGLVTGDFIFVGDLGRPDLLETAANVAGQKEPSARRLYESAQRFLDLADYLQVWPGHGAGSACGKALGAVPQSTVGYERRYNAALAAAHRGEDAFVEEILSGQPEPPLYFARMKRLNRDGAPLLDGLPAPERLNAEQIKEMLDAPDVGAIDTRQDPDDFMRRHLPGSLHAALNKSFNTAVGSVVTDPEQRILLVVDESRVDEAVRDLIRVGFDNIIAYVTPEDLDAYFDAGGAAASIERTDFRSLEERLDDPNTHVLDVRYSTEYESSHIPGAQNISYTRLADRIDEVPTGGELFVHCASGVRSAVAASLLAREGFDVHYVGDEYEAWAASRRGSAAEMTA